MPCLGPPLELPLLAIFFWGAGGGILEEADRLSDFDLLENFHNYRQVPKEIEIFLIAPSVDFLGLDDFSLPRAPCRRRCPSRERGPSL